MYNKGFTLVELIVAMIVTSIIISAVATLAFAFSTANDASGDTDRKQAQIRYASLRISELIRYSKLICGTPGNDLVIWKADDNPANNEIDLLELVYIESGNQNYLTLMEFSSCPAWLSSWFRNLSQQIVILQQNWLKDMLISRCEKTYVQVIPDCSNVQFRFDASPPQSKFVNISFELTENNTVRQYHIDSALRCWAGHLLNSDGSDLVSDDDE